MSASFELPSVDRFTVGAIGPPGQRTFYLQARLGDQVVSLKMEKQQVGALAQLLDELLEDLPAVGPLPSDLELEEPVLAEWAVGTIQLAYDTGGDRVVLLVEEAEAAGEGEAEPAGGMARLAVTREQAAAVARHGSELVASGRPRCPLCGFPVNADGHSCPRTNGHGPPSL
ncbi:MAG TPA: DUF3090 family protein [Acidimicrobiales bacterium]|nr:DUF3090 family protein [Acidimicrobiales bacterium]